MFFLKPFNANLAFKN